MKAIITAIHTDQDRMHQMEPKNMTEYAEWVIRGASPLCGGFKPTNLGEDMVLFTSQNSKVLFTVKFVNEGGTSNA